MELIDSDFFSTEHELIDRFVFNVTSPEQVRGSYPGIFGLATIDITTEVVCEPEFTGTYCGTLIDLLEVYSTLTITDDMVTTVDDKTSIATTLLEQCLRECLNGVCISGQCMCNEGFIGTSCETVISSGNNRLISALIGINLAVFALSALALAVIALSR